MKQYSQFIKLLLLLLIVLATTSCASRKRVARIYEVEREQFKFMSYKHWKKCIEQSDYSDIECQKCDDMYGKWEIEEQ